MEELMKALQAMMEDDEPGESSDAAFYSKKRIATLMVNELRNLDRDARIDVCGNLKEMTEELFNYAYYGTDETFNGELDKLESAIERSVR